MIHCVVKHLLVWATAATTLLASTPHVRCRCPDGSLKPVCFSFLTSTTSNCCGQHGHDKEEVPACCQHGDCQNGGGHAKAPSPHEDEDVNGMVRRLECHKSLVQA